MFLAGFLRSQRAFLADVSSAQCPYQRRRQLPAPAPSSAQFPSTSSASVSTTAATLRSSPRRRDVFRFSRRARKPSSASPRPRSSSASCSRQPCQSVPCGGACVLPVGPLFPSLFFLRLAGGQFLLAQDGLDARNIPAQPANLFQALRLSHIHLELQLEELVRQVPLLVLELDLG